MHHLLRDLEQMDYGTGFKRTIKKIQITTNDRKMRRAIVASSCIDTVHRTCRRHVYISVPVDASTWFSGFIRSYTTE